jgi:signal transduction histidine kinase
MRAFKINHGSAPCACGLQRQTAATSLDREKARKVCDTTLSLAKAGVIGTITPRHENLVDAALRDAQNLTDLFDTVLDLNRLTRYELDVKMGNHRPSEMIEAAVKGNAEIAGLRGVKIKVELDCDAGTYIHTDPIQARKILENYLSNAVKYSPVDEVITIRGERHNNMLRISVRDNGAGIATEKQDVLFRQFGLTDTSDTRSKRGTGLGLALVAQLAEKLNASVGVNSAPGEGSNFWVEFPLSN